jgi:hypothetical protein
LGGNIPPIALQDQSGHRRSALHDLTDTSFSRHRRSALHDLTDTKQTSMPVHAT